MSARPTGFRTAKWKKMRVVLIPKSGRDPTMTSSLRPIKVLPAQCKVWRSFEDGGMQRRRVHVAPYSETEII